MKNMSSRHQPTLGHREVVHTNAYYQVSRRMADFGEFTREYFVTHYGTRAAVVVARGKDILLCRQYRLIPDCVCWKIPGGKVDEGETLEAAAIRECFEETGIRCRAVSPLIRFQLGSDAIDNPTHIFYSTTFVEGESGGDHHEIDALSWVPLERCLGMIAASEIADALSIVGLFSYKMHRLREGNSP